MPDFDDQKRSDNYSMLEIKPQEWEKFIQLVSHVVSWHPDVRFIDSLASNLNNYVYNDFKVF